MDGSGHEAAQLGGDQQHFSFVLAAQADNPHKQIKEHLGS